MIKTVNNQLAVKPLVVEHEDNNSREAVKGFVSTDKLMKSIVTSTVVFKSEKYIPGQKVYFHADVMNHPFTKKILVINKEEFILLPEGLVLAAEENV